jgi:hypothetical protein
MHVVGLKTRGRIRDAKIAIDAETVTTTVAGPIRRYAEPPLRLCDHWQGRLIAGFF